MKPKTRLDNFLAKIAKDPEADTSMEPKSREEHYLNKIAENGGSGSGGTLPSVTWDVTVSTGFADQKVPAMVNNVEFTKVSDKAFTHGQLDGAVFDMGDGPIPLDTSMLSDMSAFGVTGTLITLPEYSPPDPESGSTDHDIFGNVVAFSCTEAGTVVPEPGFYLASQMVEHAPQITMSYKETLTAEARVIAVGTMEMEDGVTALPSGVVYLQIEG